MNAKIIKENEALPHDMHGQDLCLSVGKTQETNKLGGDSTFLKSASIIENNEQPILGVNSDPTRRTGALLNTHFDFEQREEVIPKILEDLQKENFEYRYRNRGLFTLQNQLTGCDLNKLCLNEVFTAEKDVSCTSIYRINVDNRDMGKFKSSGLLISTGTGSSGWLYSARQITLHDVRTI